MAVMKPSRLDTRKKSYPRMAQMDIKLGTPNIICTIVVARSFFLGAA